MKHRFRLSLSTVRLMALIFSIVVLIVGIVSTVHVTTNYRVPDPAGVSFEPATGGGTMVVKVVAAGSAADAAGLRVGDIVKTPPFARSMFTRFAGERIDFAVLSPAEGAKTVSMVLLPLAAKDDLSHRWAVRVLDVVVSMLSVVIAITILMRGQLTRSNVSIGLSLVCLGYTGYVLPFTSTVNSNLLTWLAAFDQTRFFAEEISMVLFAKFLYQEKIGAFPQLQTIIVRAILTVIATAGICNVWYVFVSGAPFLPHPARVRTVIGLLTAAATFILLLNCWSRSAQRERARLAILTASVRVLMMSTVLVSGGWLNWQLYVTGELLTLLFLCTFGYAVVRHRVVDLGFAINRALVFTLISTLLLIVFGITEFAVDKLLHFEGRQKNVIFDAAVALGIILSFHRIQHWVSHRIDHTFFHHWYAAAEALRTFVERAPHIVSTSALQVNYLAEMQKFCGARDVAQYLRGPDLAYHRTHGDAGMPAVIPADSRLAVALRHRRAPIDLATEEFQVDANFAFPMLLRGTVAGIVLLQPKSDGTSYRPDEIKQLAECVRSYAVDLESLRVEELERKMVDLAESKARLEHQVEVLRWSLKSANSP